MKMLIFKACDCEHIRGDWHVDRVGRAERAPPEYIVSIFLTWPPKIYSPNKAPGQQMIRL